MSRPVHSDNSVSARIRSNMLTRKLLFAAAGVTALHLLRHRFRLASTRSKLPPSTFKHVFVTKPTIQHALGQVRIAADILQLLRQDGDTVVVRAQPDMIDAGHLGDVLDVVQHVMDRAALQRVSHIPFAQQRPDMFVLLGVVGCQLLAQRAALFTDLGGSGTM